MSASLSLASLLMICTNPDLGYEGMVGAVILGGIFEGVVGLSAQYWKKYLTPVVSSCVVIAIGLSLLPVGMNSWGGGSGSESFGSWYHLLVGLVTLIVCLVSRYLLHGVYKNLNILVGLIFGYILSAIFTVAGIAPMIDFSGISKTISEIGFSAFQDLSSSLVIHRYLTLEHSLQLRLSSWFLLLRQPELQQQYVKDL